MSSAPKPVTFRIYCASSLDGFIAGEGGDVRWLEPYQDADYGYNTFLASIRTVVMGRKTYEFARSLERWEYPGKQSIVLTSRELENLPAEVDTTPGPISTLVADLRRNARGDVWVMGGAAVMGAFLDADAVDVLDLYIIPVVLGRGVPLFSRSGPPAQLKLQESTKFANGVVRAVYEPVRS